MSEESEWKKESPVRPGYYWARLKVAPRDPKTDHELSRTVVVHVWRDDEGWHIQNNNRLYDLSEIAEWGRRIETGKLSENLSHELHELHEGINREGETGK